MRRIAIFLFSFVAIWFAPGFVHGACLIEGATVIYVNGIFTSLDDAQIDLATLQAEYRKRTNDKTTKFINGYNPSHVGGVGDLLKSIMQAYQPESEALLDTDAQTILHQIEPEVSTQKILLLGHSQGTFYTNALYQYLTSHGVPADSIAVYNIATPASYVAGGGGYLTSATDKLINKVRDAIRRAPSSESFGAGIALATLEQHGPKLPLPANTVLALSLEEQQKEVGGHSFNNVYLKNGTSIIIPYIQSSISKLASSPDRIDSGCFEPPKQGLGYEVGKVGLALFDVTADGLKAGIRGGLIAAAFLKDFALEVAEKTPANIVAGVSKVGEDISITIGGTKALANAADEDSYITNFKLFKALYGSSLSAEEVAELLGQKPQKVALKTPEPGEVLGEEAPPPFPPPEPLQVPIPEPTQVVDDIAKNLPAGVSFGGGDAPPPAPSGPPPSDDSAGDDDIGGGEELPAEEPFVLGAPQNITFSGWTSSDSGLFCDVIDRTADISWDAVDGATGYKVWKYTAHGGWQELQDVTTTSVADISLAFGLNWATSMDIAVVAYSADGQRATTTVSANDMAVDKDGPVVSVTSPSLGATDVSVIANVTFSSSEALYPNNLDNSFALFKLILNEFGVYTQDQVSASLSLSADGTIVTLTPASPLEYDTGYRMNVSCKVKDLSGNHGANLLLPFGTTPYFTTEAAAPVIE